jgi:CTP-dependent riboflavin kinase
MNDTPAFPINNMNTGMALRDYFAAKAMQALINKGGSFVVVPTQAYAIADVMMQARGETK